MKLLYAIQMFVAWSLQLAGPPAGRDRYTGPHSRQTTHRAESADTRLSPSADKSLPPEVTSSSTNQRPSRKEQKANRDRDKFKRRGGSASSR